MREENSVNSECWRCARPLVDGLCAKCDDHTCDECGGEIRAGAWPFCKGDPSAHTPSKIHGHYDPFRPYVDEHIASDGRDVGLNYAGDEIVRGTYITSREHRRALMKANGLDWHGRSYGGASPVEF